MHATGRAQVRMASVAGAVTLAWAASAVAPAVAAPGDLLAGFGTGGLYTAAFQTTFPGAEHAQTLAVDSQGRIYLAATFESGSQSETPWKVRVQRLSPAGVLDPGFGTGGTFVVPFPGNTRSAGIVVDGGDRPLILGAGAGAGGIADGSIELARMTPAGALDPSFGGGDGLVDEKLPGETFYGPAPAGIAIDANGGVLVAGTAFYTSLLRYPFITRFDSGGAPDTGYGTGGIAKPMADDVRLADVRALPGGGAVVGGYDALTVSVARVGATGAPDGTFGTGGIASSSLGRAPLDTVSSYGLAVDAQNRPVLGAQITTSLASTGAVVRFTADGHPDTSFGTAAGVVRFPYSTVGRVNDIASLPAGGSLITGLSQRPSQGDNRIVLARLDGGGALDAAFAPASAVAGAAFTAVSDRTGGTRLALSGTTALVAGFVRTDGAPSVTHPLVAAYDLGAAGAAPAQQPAQVPAPANAPAPAPAAGALPTVAGLVTFPATRACASRRGFAIRLRVPKGSEVVKAEVRLNAKSVAVRRGVRLRSTVNLRGLPKGRFTVQITLTLRDGRTVKDARRYRTCTPKRRR